MNFDEEKHKHWAKKMLGPRDIDNPLKNWDAEDALQERCIFVIPARKSSKGLPFKNRTLFKHTAESIPSIFSSNVIVTSDDWSILQDAKSYGFQTIHRDQELSGDDVSIRDVLLDVKSKKELDNVDIVMLYLTYPERTFDDIYRVYCTYDNLNARSLLCRKQVKTHPYMCYVATEDNRGKKVVEHDLYRRQDYPTCFEVCHYVAIINSNMLSEVDRNLYHPSTVFCPLEFENEPIDVDTISDYNNFINKEERAPIIARQKLRTADQAEFLLLSAERSGNTWLRYYLEYVFKRPTVGYGPADDPLLIQFDEVPIALKRHSWDIEEQADLRYPAYNKVIFLLRDYKEIYFRLRSQQHISVRAGLRMGKLDETNSTAEDHFKDCLTNLKHSGLVEIVDNIKMYDKLSAPKMIIYYEDLIKTPEAAFGKVKDFITSHSTHDSDSVERIDNDFRDFIDSIEHNSKLALAKYKTHMAGPHVESPRNAEHENLKNTKYYSSACTKDSRRLMDISMREHIGEELYDKYLTRYMEQN
tara:strand:+ start:8812 stop:10395 length:1584 start_codon:yes stop_codon:yes gene_type:complete